AFVELRVANEAVDPASRQRGADRDAEPVAERAARDLDARRELAIGVVSERRVERAEAVELVHGDDALGPEHGVERRRAMALREQEAILVAEDAVVQDPEHVEGGERAAVVFLVAGQSREQLRQVVVAVFGCRRRGCHSYTVEPQLWFKSSG